MAADFEHVLIVDDFDEGRRICAEYLAFHGYRVSEACDGEEALAMVRALRPDLVLLDLALPVIDGWEVVRRLREDDATRSLAVLAFTAHALEDARRRALDAGCDAVLTKPVVPKDLERRVRETLDARRDGVSTTTQGGP